MQMRKGNCEKGYLNATSAAIFCFTRAWLQMQTLLGYLALSSNFGGFRDSRLSQNDSAVKIKPDFLGVIFCCPMEIVPPQMKIQCDRCVIFHSVSSSLSVASLSCLFVVETSLYLLLKHVPVDPFISFSFIHSSLTLLKGKKVNFAYYKLKGTVSQGFCSRLIPLKSQ